MELAELLIKSENPSLIFEVLNEARFQKPSIDYNKSRLTWDVVRSQLDPKHHKITDTNPITGRPDKNIMSEDGLNLVKTVQVARIPLPYQQKIVDLATSFTCGNGINMGADTDDDDENGFVLAVKKVWNDNKLQYKMNDICRRMIGETEAAVMFYYDEAEDSYWDDTVVAEPNQNLKLRVKIISPSTGDELLPMFDSMQDMIGFGRHYFTRTTDNRQVENLEIYTDKWTRYYSTIDEGKVYELVKEVPNPIGKIQVIYFSQIEPEWLSVQPIIERQEVLTSNFADTNDYNGAPILAFTGNVTGMSDKGESGKMIQMSAGSKAEYVTWAQAPAAIEFEATSNDNNIYSMTQTPDISFNSLKKLSLGRLTGVAIKLLFMDAQMKAAKKQQGAFGEGIQRMINFIKHALAVIKPQLKSELNLYIQPIFSTYLPADEMEMLNDIITAYNAGILSQETAVSLNPLIEDGSIELDKIKKEKSDALAQNASLGMYTPESVTGPGKETLKSIQGQLNA